LQISIGCRTPSPRNEYRPGELRVVVSGDDAAVDTVPTVVRMK
jgi:hypothetical protein